MILRSSYLELRNFKNLITFALMVCTPFKILQIGIYTFSEKVSVFWKKGISLCPYVRTILRSSYIKIT